MDWIYSSIDVAGVSVNDLDGVYDYFEAIRVREGAIRIPKEIGIFFPKIENSREPPVTVSNAYLFVPRGDGKPCFVTPLRCVIKGSWYASLFPKQVVGLVPSSIVLS